MAVNMKIYTFGHSARSLEDFKFALNLAKIDILIDLRKKPQSRYFPHYNRKNLEDVFKQRYIFGGDFLGGSPEFHNDLLEYIQNRGENLNNVNNKLIYLIDADLKSKIFSKDPQFSNDEKRKYWITLNYLHDYMPEKSEQAAVDFLQQLFKKYSDQKICFFCSEKEPTHCHRYHLLEKRWVKNFSDIEVVHIEDLIKQQEVNSNSQSSLFNF